MERSIGLQKLVDALAISINGRSLSEAHAEKVCVECGKSVLKWSTDPVGPDWAFEDALSLKEYRISGMCQACQDSFFKDPPEPEDEEAPDHLAELALREEEERLERADAEDDARRDREEEDSLRREWEGELW